MKKIPLILVGVALNLFACSEQAQVLLTTETGPAGTVPFTSMMTLAELATTGEVADFQIADGQTLTNSLQNVAEGKTDIAGAPLSLTHDMSNGAGPYVKLGKQAGAELAGNVRALYTYNYGGFGLYAYKTSSVKGWDSVKGKKILNGPPRGAALRYSRRILSFVSGVNEGDGYKGLQVNWGQMARTISDGSVDAMMLPVTFPDARITQALAAGDMTIWSVPKDIWQDEGMQKFVKSPGTSALVFDLKNLKSQKGLTVVSEDGVWRSPAVVGAEMVHKDMDFMTAKALTAMMLKNTELFLTKTPYMSTTNIGQTELSLSGLCGEVPLKYHPGAIAAFEEAGMTIPICAKPE